MQNNESDDISLKVTDDIINDQEWRFKMDDLSWKYAFDTFFRSIKYPNPDDIPGYLIYEYKNPKDTGDFISEDGKEILYVRKEYKKYTHEEIEDMFDNLQALLLSALSDFQWFVIDDFEKRISKTVKEETHKAVSNIAMKMLYNQMDKSYISEITGISLNELNILQWFVERRTHNQDE